MRRVPILLAGCALVAAARAAEIPETLEAKGERVVLEAHAVGAQVYECKAQADGGPVWRFREPIALLMRDGKTVGRHYGGPTWEIEGSAVVGKAVAHAPGATARDVPWLKLDVVDRRGDGPLKGVSTVQRIATQGGVLEGACASPGELRAEPYAADYRFLAK